MRSEPRIIISSAVMSRQSICSQVLPHCTTWFLSNYLVLILDISWINMTRVMSRQLQTSRKVRPHRRHLMKNLYDEVQAKKHTIINFWRDINLIKMSDVPSWLCTPKKMAWWVVWMKTEKQTGQTGQGHGQPEFFQKAKLVIIFIKHSRC